MRRFAVPDAGIRSARMRGRLSYANVMATIAVLIALGGTAYAVTKINGKSIKKHTILGNRLKDDTLTGLQVNESKLDKVPLAAKADNATHADSASSADNATKANSATTADSATTATSATTAANADNAAALGGLSAAQLKATSFTSIGGTCANPTSATSCGSATVNLPATSDVFVLGTGLWYGTDSGDNSEAGECFITRDPATNTPSSIRQEMGQTDDTHDDFERSGAIAIQTTIQDVPAGSSTFRLRCDENDADFHVEDVVVSVIRLSP
jgi:hypothetical protein